MIQQEALDLKGYSDAKAVLRVFVAKGSEALSQIGSCRTGGIVIKSFRACHEATLFGFDEDEYAAKLFGDLECDKIDELQRAGERFGRKNGDALPRQPLFPQSLIKSARAIIEALVIAEK